jgi:predicted nucleic acid-binding protein
MMSDEKTKVFLDTSVMIRLFSDDPDAWSLFSKPFVDRFTYVIAPTVAHELMHAGAVKTDEDLDALMRHVEVLPVANLTGLRDLQGRVRALRNSLAHPNGIIVLGTAEQAGCKYLVTLDHKLLDISDAADVIVRDLPTFLSEERP